MFVWLMVQCQNMGDYIKLTLAKRTPADTCQQTDTGFMLGHCLRRCANINPTLVQEICVSWCILCVLFDTHQSDSTPSLSHHTT